MKRRRNPDDVRMKSPETLAECETQEQVARELERGNDALQEDVDEKLYAIKQRAKRAQWDPVDQEPWWDSDGVIEGVVDYLQKHYVDSLGQVPREKITKAVRENLKREHDRGSRYDADRTVFSIQERRRGAGAVTVSETYFPSEVYVAIDEDDHEQKIPYALVKDALEEVYGGGGGGGGGDGDWYDHGDGFAWLKTDDGDSVPVTASEERLDEFVHDLRGEFFSGLYKKDPHAAKLAFMQQVGSLLDYALYARLQKHQDAIPEEEWGDLCSILWQSSAENAAEELTEKLAEYLDVLEMPSLAETDPARVVGVIEFHPKQGTKTDLPENDRSPWTVIRLTPGDLSLEGSRMRHCVGRKSMEYHQALKRGEIEIWSVRTPTGKPVFTIEVDVSINDPKPRGFSKAEHESGRGSAILQVKGKVNRLPGFSGSDASNLNTFRFPNEVRRLARFFEKIGVNPLDVNDLFPGIRALGETGHTAWDYGPLENPEHPERSFDEPHVPM